MHGRGWYPMALGMCLLAGSGTGVLWAQLPSHILQAAEQAHEAEEAQGTDPEAMEAEDREFAYPLFLNQATPSTLESSGLFTAYQIHRFLCYRERHGPLLSIYELAGIDGFRPEYLERIEALIQTGPMEKGPSHTTTFLQTRIFMGCRYPIPPDYRTEPGESTPNYAGSPLNTGMRITARLPKKIHAGLAMGKDPGETMWAEGKPEFLGGYLQFNPGGKLQQLILGRYLVQSGLGLVHGSRQFQGSTGFHRGRIYSKRIRPYGGGREWGVQQGVAAQFRFSSLELCTWVSREKTDLSLHGVEKEAPLELSAQFRREGLHRTRSERNGRDLAWITGAGLQVGWKHRNLDLNLLASGTLALASQELKDSISASIPKQGQQAYSLHACWRPGRLEIFGELVPAGREHLAFQSGFRYHLNDFLQLGSLVYSYGSRFRMLYSSAFAYSSSPSNERGMLVHVHAGICSWLEAEASLHTWASPHPRYGSLLPSSASIFRLDLHSPEYSRIKGSLGIRKRISERTPSMTESGFRETQRNGLLSMDARMEYAPTERFSTSLRMLLRYTEEWGLGDAFMLQSSIHLGDAGLLRFQALGYRIPHWDLRMSIYEPGLYRHFSFPVYNGTGQKISILMNLKLWDNLVLEVKYSLGRKLAEDKSRQELGLQIRVKL